ncbi:hypothetical protein [Stenotrophomonas panacihumi]|nr:hypothetical protein [Stenotrophomonas panacihumi]
MAAGLSACLLAGCGLWMSKVSVHNAGLVPLEHVEVRLGGQRIAFGALEAGATSSQYFNAITDSGGEASYRLQGEAHDRDCRSDDIYLTNGMTTHVRLDINGAACRFTEVDR